jgi:hypothetical protein
MSEAKALLGNFLPPPGLALSTFRIFELIDA